MERWPQHCRRGRSAEPLDLCPEFAAFTISGLCLLFGPAFELVRVGACHSVDGDHDRLRGSFTTLEHIIPDIDSFFRHCKWVLCDCRDKLGIGRLHQLESFRPESGCRRAHATATRRQVGHYRGLDFRKSINTSIFLSSIPPNAIRVLGTMLCGALRKARNVGSSQVISLRIALE